MSAAPTISGARLRQEIIEYCEKYQVPRQSFSVLSGYCRSFVDNLALKTLVSAAQIEAVRAILAKPPPSELCKPVLRAVAASGKSMSRAEAFERAGGAARGEAPILIISPGVSGRLSCEVRVHPQSWARVLALADADQVEAAAMLARVIGAGLDCLEEAQ